VGFPKYLKFDGVDDDLITNSIDFSATDEMTVWGGVRKVGTALDAIWELSINAPTKDGSFGLFSGYQTGNVLQDSKGSAVYSRAQSPAIAQPYTKTLSSSYKIGSDINKLRVNGTQVAESTTDQGTGNYGNYPFFIGARAGTSLFFNGHLYGLIARGKTTAESKIKQIEKGYISQIKL
jgi:hypothetical protein